MREKLKTNQVILENISEQKIEDKLSTSSPIKINERKLKTNQLILVQLRKTNRWKNERKLLRPLMSLAGIHCTQADFSVAFSPSCIIGHLPRSWDGSSEEFYFTNALLGL